MDEHLDLHNLMGITTQPGHQEFTRYTLALPFAEKAYIRVTSIPNQTSTTTIRAEIWIWEQ